jgi:transposase
VLTPKLQAEILSLHFAEKRAIRAIAIQLQISRKAVRRVVRARAVALTPKSPQRSSILDAYKAQIQEKLQKHPEIRAKTLMQLMRDQGYTGGYTIFAEWVSSQRKKEEPKKEADLKMDFAPGEAAQIDWGEFPNALGDGMNLHVFVMVLCYSRKIYIEFTRAEKFEDFIRCHENAFRYFENLYPERCWYDNLPAAVSERFGSLVRFNTRFLAYCGHHGFKPYACNVRRGNEKGRVEDGVKLIRSNFWEGREFKNFVNIKEQATHWRDSIANCREHRATRKIPDLVFTHNEKFHLKECNPVPYETDEIFSRELRDDFHVIYETNQYSAPWTLVGSVVTIRIDADWVRIYYKDQFVTRHERCYLKHQLPRTHPEHKEGLLKLKPQGKAASLHWQLEVIQSYGECFCEYLKYLQYNSRSLRQEVTRLLALATVYSKEALQEAVVESLKRGAIGCEQIELHLKSQNKKPVQPAPLNLDLKNKNLSQIPPAVDLRRYDALLFNPAPKANSPAVHLSEKENVPHE